FTVGEDLLVLDLNPDASTDYYHVDLSALSEISLDSYNLRTPVFEEGGFFIADGGFYGNEDNKDIYLYTYGDSESIDS
mgnify:CR=1